MIVHQRDEWQPRDPVESKLTGRSMDQVDTLFVHWSDVAPPWVSALDPAADAAAVAAQLRAIQAFHMDTRGWGDIGYTWALDPAGDIWALRPPTVVPAAVLDHNADSVSLCVLTNGDPSSVQVGSLWAWANDVQSFLGRPLRLEGHREANPTACPGDGLQTALEALRDATGHVLPLPAPTTTPTGPAGNSGDSGASGGIVAAPFPLAGTAETLPVLREGSQGDDVAALQGLLMAFGHTSQHSQRADGAWDGVFGPGTLSAVENFQAEKGLTVDGIVGAHTWAALGAPE